MKALCCWINARTGFGDWCGRMAESPMEGGPCWCKVLPCTILFAFCVEAITGFFLWAYYSPSAQTAWESVYYVQYEVAGGWLLRAIHHYTAHVLLALLILAVLKYILTGAYRAPRELLFWATVALALCALAAILTGDLLYWDQNGYAATRTRTGFLTFLPVVGDWLLKIAIGEPGPSLGHLTLTRFFALHVGLFGGGFIVLLVIREVLARRVAAVAAAAGNAMPYWPAQAWRGAVACLAVMAVILLLACQHGVKLPEAGVPLLSPADTDPANFYKAARPEWFLIGVFEFRGLFSGALVPVFIVPGLAVCILFAMPFLAKHAIGQVFNVLFTVCVLAALVALSWYSLAKDRADPVQQKALAVEKEQAQRVLALIRHNKGIPPTGALSLLQKDPKTQGPRLFAQNCASCHEHAGNDQLADIKVEKPSAPNLAHYASRQWLTGLLDPKRINGPDYFGHTRFRGGKMAGFVKETLGELDAGEKEKLQKVIMAVSAEAQLPGQKDADAKDAKAIEEGRKILVSDFACTDCHKFRDKGALGDAPELTGYGSPPWIAGIIADPAQKRFYGKLNDRMPAYAPSADATQNSLHPDQIKMLTDWLRGDWDEGQGFEPGN